LLHADVIRKQGVPADERQPVILAIGPYFAHIGQSVEDADPLRSGPNVYYTELLREGKPFDRGYTVVQVDLRGFGASEGCNDFGGKGEQADVKAAVEWAATQPWSNGKVGMFGKSYDGWTLVMGLATTPKGLAAVVIQAPIISGYRALYMNGVHYALGWYGTPALYQSGDALPPTVFDSPEYILHSALGLDPLCYALNIALQTGFTDRDDGTGFWDERDLIPRAAGSEVPTLWEHGFLDANAKPDNFLDLYSTLRGPRRVWAGQWQHDRPTEELIGRKGFYEESMRWFDRYVKGLPEDQAPVGSDPGAEIEDGGTQRWRAEAVWPPADASARKLTVRPGTHTNVPGNSAGGEAPGLLTGEGLWSVSKPLPHDVHLAGTPRLSLDVTTSAARCNLFAIVYDVDAKGQAQVLTRAAYAVTRSGTIAFDLYPQDWTFAAGHRVGLLIAPSDDEWFLPPPTLTSVRIGGGALSLPFLRYTRSSFLPGRKTKAEEDRVPPIDASGQIAGAETAFDVPPALTDPPAAPLPVAAKRPRLTVALRRLDGRRVRASGRGPAGLKLRVRVVDGRKHTLVTRRVTIGRHGSWRLTLRVARRSGRTLRAVVSAPVAGTTLRVTSRRVR
jgi:predicted acyl esterase